MADPRPVPKAPRYPEWVDDTEGGHARYDLALAMASESLQELPTSSGSIMAAQVIYNGMDRAA